MQRYFSKLKDDNKFKLNLDDGYHITKVMRMGYGDLIEVVYEEKLYICKIIELNPVIAEIIEESNTYNELEVKVTICQSLVKENKMDLIIQKCVELGAYSFLPLEARNSIIRLTLKDKIKKVERWQKIVEGACCQSKRNIIPKVLDIMEIKDIIKLDYDLKILLSVNEVSSTFKNVLQNHKMCGTIIIVIGSEGGFTKLEEDELVQNGFVRATLGKRVLRTETAPITALSMINYEYER